MNIELTRLLPNGTTKCDVNVDYICWIQDCIEPNYSKRGALTTLFIEAGEPIHAAESRADIRKMVQPPEAEDAVVPVEVPKVNLVYGMPEREFYELPMDEQRRRMGLTDGQILPSWYKPPEPVNVSRSVERRVEQQKAGQKR